MSSYKLTITNPCDSNSIVDYSLSFRVDGLIEHSDPVPNDAILCVQIFDKNDKEIRRVTQNKKNNNSVFIAHPELTCYSEAEDPNQKGLLQFGFPELMVRDTTKPYDSLRDASIKCFYNDDTFKALIISASNITYGAPADDGIDYYDENCNPYELIPEGDYIIQVSLSKNDGTTLAETQKLIHIQTQKNRAILRFNPETHKKKISAWAKENNYSVIENWLPGYLEPYLGKWTKHMGLLTMYRANDLGLFKADYYRMFVYLIDPTSTSYETELAYLQTKGIVGNSEKFHAYYYDVGEAIFGDGKPYKREAIIKEFLPDEFIKITRIDTVNSFAKENVFNITEEAVISTNYCPEQVIVSYGDNIAITGVIKPLAFDSKYFELKKDNTYKITNKIEYLEYTFSNNEITHTFKKSLLLQRIDKESIGFSVFEFYNLFKLESPFTRGTWTVNIQGYDSYDNLLPVNVVLEIIIE